jgi:hypothetical protein
LLTLDQLGRAATLICALELIRQTDRSVNLGDWPFEIGLWVGKSATPNRMGSTRQGDNDENTARRRTLKYLANETRFPPVPLENCPWCGKAFNLSRFDLARALRPFTRCMACNEPLRAASQAEVYGRVPPGAAEWCDEFRECIGCWRVYWRGSHYWRMRRWIEQLAAAPQAP